MLEAIITANNESSSLREVCVGHRCGSVTARIMTKIDSMCLVIRPMQAQRFPETSLGIRDWL